MSKNQSKLTDAELAALMAEDEAQAEQERTKGWRPKSGCMEWQTAFSKEIFAECQKMWCVDEYSCLVELLKRLGCRNDDCMAVLAYDALEKAFLAELRVIVGRS